MKSFLDKSKQLLEDEIINSFACKKVLIAGIGGVGGTAFEALVRSGFENFILIDFDVVDITNLNRQILYTSEDVGQEKLLTAKRKALKINEKAKIKLIKQQIELNSFDNFSEKVDIIIDAIDYIPGKIALAKYATEHNIPFISSLGMGNRIDPEKVTITKLNKTENDPLAKKLRYELKTNGIDLKTINVVFSKETPLIKSPKPASMMMVPSTAGLLIAKFVIDTFMEANK